MSSELAIEVTDLSKRYEIYAQPRQRLKQFILPPLQKMAGRAEQTYFQEFWALKNVSFDVRRGETIGVIGRNGSGKSTLLQMICGTLNPTGGTVEAHGRVAALLELGSGFNPEFTGRENVYMNAAVLGLKQDEIELRFNDIVAFADIGQFIEQPVKTYSSGMMLRLAFAVIAHVDADILVVDEALAVGDAVFTQKCMRFIRKFREQGTLVFVSHDTSSVINLCERAIWLHDGTVRMEGQAKAVSEAYLQYTLQQVYGGEAQLANIEKPAYSAESTPDDESVTRYRGSFDYGGQANVTSNLSEAGGWKSGSGEITSVAFENVSSPGAELFAGGETIKMRIKAVAHKDIDRPILGFLLSDRLGQNIFGENTLPFTAVNPLPVPAGHRIEGTFRFELPMLPNGEYVVMASLADGDLHNNIQHHWLHDALIVRVSSSKIRWGLVGIKFDEVMMREIK